ncbi:MAG: DNA alkylation repair protein [Acidobacteria bacterium]|nr:MAG: DNA alkylation repair protein [Acidobacteriota bacterium]
MLRDLRRDLRTAASARRAEVNKWFFKTGPGEYGEGDRFLGVTLPHLRRIARDYQTLPSSDVVRLLHSKWHEERLLALFILVRQYAGGDTRTRGVIHRLYLHNTGFINSWDLVDSSAAQIVGAHLENGDRRVLRHLARSTSVWERRIAIIATYHYIRKGEFSDALAIAALLCHDEHDLIHKAVGWMLREIGKRNRDVEERFLRRHAQTMPRTMLRYAVEKFPDRLRRKYLGRLGAGGRRTAGPAASTGRLSRD